MYFWVSKFYKRFVLKTLQHVIFFSFFFAVNELVSWLAKATTNQLKNTKRLVCILKLSCASEWFSQRPFNLCTVNWCLNKTKKSFDYNLKRYLWNVSAYVQLSFHYSFRSFMDPVTDQLHIFIRLGSFFGGILSLRIPMKDWHQWMSRNVTLIKKYWVVVMVVVIKNLLFIKNLRCYISITFVVWNFFL